MLQTIWARVAALQVIATGLLAGSLWLITEGIDPKARSAVMIPGVILLIFATLAGVLELFRAGWPRATADQFDFGAVVRGVRADRDRYMRDIPHATQEQLRARRADYESVSLVSNLIDVADQLQQTNADRLYQLRRSTLWLTTATALFFGLGLVRLVLGPT
jgi:hypothetical protein